jgi:2-polyprenyl-3-methyl-5-hydroxy-6-metoxy-1,4-benzoquinol methylase
MAEAYVREYHNTEFRNALPTPEAFRRQHAVNMRWFDDNYLALLPADRAARILDVGCGRGEFLFWLKERGFHGIEGVDISEHIAAYCREVVGCEVAQSGDIETFLTDRRYDVIHLGDVIEHFPKTSLFSILRAIRGALRPGGFLLVRTPNAVGLAGLYMRYNSLTHELIFNDRTIKKAFQAGGFDRIDVQGERFGWRLRPRFLAWMLLRALWFRLMRLIYVIELGVEAPKVLTRNLIARGWKA